MAVQYTDIEDKYIEDNYIDKSDEFIAKKLGRTFRGLIVHRLKLGFYRPADLSGTTKRNRLISKRIEIVALRSFLHQGVMVDIALNRLNELEKDVPPSIMVKNNHSFHPLKSKAKAFEMLKSGKLAIDVAKYFNVYPQTISYWKKSFNNYNGLYPTTITLQSKINDN